MLMPYGPVVVQMFSPALAVRKRKWMNIIPITTPIERKANSFANLFLTVLPPTRLFI